MAKTAFDFNLDDKTRLENLFGPEGNLKNMWLFNYLSFHDQELMILELRYKQYAEEFTRLNEFQKQGGRYDCQKKMQIKCIVCSNFSV